MAAYELEFGPTGVSVESFARIHHLWLSHREGAKIPGKLPRWTKGPPRDYEIAYTHGALWVDFGDRDEVILCSGLDLHVGTSAFNPVAVESLLQWVEDHNAYFVLPGDVVNNAHLSKFGAAEEVLNFDQAVDYATELLEPMAHRLLQVVLGNHEERTVDEIGADPARHVARNLGVPYCQGPVLGELIVSGTPWRIHVEHGAGCGRSEGWKRTFALAPFATGRGATAIVSIRGHIHHPLAEQRTLFDLDPEDGKRRWRNQIGLVCGASHRYAGYAERKSYDPAMLGTSYVKLTADGVIPSQDKGGYGVVRLEGADA